MNSGVAEQALNILRRPHLAHSARYFLTPSQAGAIAQDALRSIVISQQLLGTNEILLIKHTGCGMLTFQNKDAYAVVEKNLGYVFLLPPRHSDLDVL